MERFVLKQQGFCHFPPSPHVSVESSRGLLCVFFPSGLPSFSATLTHGGKGGFGYGKTTSVPTFYKTLSFVKETEGFRGEYTRSKFPSMETGTSTEFNNREQTTVEKEENFGYK